MGEKSEADVMEITGDDAAFILGSGGKTKSKMAQVSGANLYIVEKASKARPARVLSSCRGYFHCLGCFLWLLKSAQAAVGRCTWV